MDLKKIDLNKLQDYAFTVNELASIEAASWNCKFINIKCLDNESIVPTVKAIPIPEGVTNGDMIKAIFPDADVKEMLGSRSQDYLWDWWGLPYKGREE